MEEMQKLGGIDERRLMELLEVQKEMYALNVKTYELLQQIKELLGNKINNENFEVSVGTVEKSKAQQLRHVIALHLKRLGVSTQLNGYEYLKEGIALVIENPEIFKGGITKVFYPEMAKIFDTTANRVERAVRHAIQSGCDKISVNTIQKYFGETIGFGEKPKNCQFIFTLAEIIQEELNY